MKLRDANAYVTPILQSTGVIPRLEIEELPNLVRINQNDCDGEYAKKMMQEVIDRCNSFN